MTDKRDLSFQVRLSKKEFDMAQAASEARGMTTAGFLRWALVNEAGKPMIDAWSIERGDVERAKSCIWNPSTPHLRLEPIKLRSRELVARVFVWELDRNYHRVQSVTHIADRDFIRDREKYRLFLRGSGTYKLVNSVEMSEGASSSLILFLELDEPLPLK